MLHRARLVGYKTFRDVELRPAPLTVLVGANASGKSNLLDGLRLLARFVNERTLLHAFEGHRGRPAESFHFAGQDADALFPGSALSMTLEADIELSHDTCERVAHQVHTMGEGRQGAVISQPYLRYHLELQMLPESGRLRVADERLEALRRDGSPKASRNALLEREGKHLHLRREGGGHPYYHEIGLDRTIVCEPLYPPHFPHAVALREELSRWRVHRFEPAGMRLGGAHLAADSVGGTGGQLAAFLHRTAVEAPDELALMTERARRLLPFIDGIQVQGDADGALQLRVVEHGRPVPARLASSGTLRILAVLAAVSPRSGATLVALEEPEASVHPRRLGELAAILREATEQDGLQILVSTHSSAFARLFANDALLLCERTGWETFCRPFAEGFGGLFRDAALEDATDE